MKVKIIEFNLSSYELGFLEKSILVKGTLKINYIQDSHSIEYDLDNILISIESVELVDFDKITLIPSTIKIIELVENHIKKNIDEYIKEN